MAIVTIAHALFTWREAGDHRIAYHGDQVEIPDDIVDRYRHLGVFGSPATNAVTAVADPTENDPAPVNRGGIPTVALDPDRPKNAATRPVWEAYAVGRGLDPAALEEMNKDSIIAAINELDASLELDATQEQEQDNG